MQKKKKTITPTPKEDIQLSVGKLGSILVQFIFYNLQSHAVNLPMQPPLLKGHLFLVLS